MADEEYLLKWNDYKSSFSAMIQGICLKDEMTDCTISNGSRNFLVHRLILSMCSSYLRSLFSSIPHSQHPVLVINDVQDKTIEMLIGYMYSGQVSVTQDDIVPLLDAAKSLGVKGLLDVPFPTTTEEPEPERIPAAPITSSLQKPGPPPLKKLKSAVNRPSQKLNVIKNRMKYPNMLIDNSLLECMEDVKEEEGVDPLELHQNGKSIENELLSHLTDEMSYSVIPDTGSLTASSPKSKLLLESSRGGDKKPGVIIAEPKRILGNGDLAGMVLYSCSHCGKEFTSKRKHQRHVLNVHFRYNPVQCPFCQKGHRDNYNLKQHVCPVINMKYGKYENSGANLLDSPDKPKPAIVEKESA